MTTGLPPAVEDDVSAYLTETIGEEVMITGFVPVGGGCINHGGRLTTTSGIFFLKWNTVELLTGMFAAESRGLSLLEEQCVVRVPKVIGHREVPRYQWIVMEWIESARAHSHCWADLGQQLAKLHQCSHRKFGLDYNNYIGSLPQFNTVNDSWIDFFISQRLEVQLKLAVSANKADASLITSFEKIYKKLPDLLPQETPSLLHGDLWNGNIMTDDNGNPCLIDPATYFGHHEAEIAFTSLFGGFDDEFYSSYNETFPLTPGFAKRQDIYNLYPLMVHVNLFGGGYLNQVKMILKKFGV